MIRYAGVRFEDFHSTLRSLQAVEKSLYLDCGNLASADFLGL